MINLQKYQNKRIAIYGMGLTGCSAAKTLNKLGAKIFCWDDNRKTRKRIKNLKFPLNKFWLNKNIVDNIVISPGIDISKCKIKNYLKKNLKKIITDLDIFFDLNKDCQIISITGTNGKSTTCKIIEKILKTAKYNVKTLGNIGDPILSFGKTKKKCIFILEISSYQLQYSKSFRSRHAAILNISPDHLERHKSIKNYTKVKSRIFSAQGSSDYAYINFTNKYSKPIINILKSKKLKSKIIQIRKSNCKSLIKKVNNKYFKDKGNIENMTFAYQIAKNLKIKNKIIIKGLNGFKGLPHRQEIVFSNKSILCINDSKATSFAACLQSLSNYKKIHWIVGGQPKHKDRFYLKKVKKRIVKAYIIGKNILFFKKQIGKSIPFSVSKNIKDAVNNIYKDLKFSKSFTKTILLSPAAASFDQFINFEDRGNSFKNLIIKKFNNEKNV
jgi:UDP-N-acetylmuramoylalanine--D-glutamate ligase